MFRHGILLSLLLSGTACLSGSDSPSAPGAQASAGRLEKAQAVTGAKALRDRLAKPITLEAGIQPNTTLKEALEFIGDRMDLTIVLDTQAFKLEGMDSMEGVPVQLPKMVDVKLSTVLRLLLAQLDATYLVCSDHLEVTTWKRVRPGFWMGEGQSLAPQVSAEFDRCPLGDALRQLSDSSGISIVLDSRAGEQAGTKVTATLNNVPVDAAVLMLADMANLRPVAVENALYVTSPGGAQLLEKRLGREDRP
ncbi:MAG TPA: hypothetical protein VKU02_01615 [Gemmataceae bacterium]|nr:hypothetical protein [Gemmataceae bacterium]